MNYAHEREERARPKAPLEPVYMPLRDNSLEYGMLEYLESRALSYSVAVENGWYAAFYKGAPRVIIPASTLVNTWPYFQGRAMDDHPKRYESPSAPRGDALAVVYPSGRIQGIVILEGPMDALAAAGEGFVGVGLMGNTPGDAVLGHLESILKAFPVPCLVIPDKDALDKGAEVTSKLWTRGLKCVLKTIQGAKDLAELRPEQRKRLLDV
jgi:hypothetical protein